MVEINGERTLTDTVLTILMFKQKLKNISILRGAAGTISDHYLVEEKLTSKIKFLREKIEREGIRK